LAPRVVEVAAGAVVSVPLTVSAPAGVQGRRDLHFAVASADGGVHRDVDSSFFGPMP
jgi:hypothetical protein